MTSSAAGNVWMRLQKCSEWKGNDPVTAHTGAILRLTKQFVCDVQLGTKKKHSTACETFLRESWPQWPTVLHPPQRLMFLAHGHSLLLLGLTLLHSPFLYHQSATFPRSPPKFLLLPTHSRSTPRITSTRGGWPRRGGVGLQSGPWSTSEYMSHRQKTAATQQQRMVATRDAPDFCLSS